jgi:hypothetical protein
VTAAFFFQRSSRDDVSEYIERVNEAQGSFAVRYGAVDRVYREFQLSPTAATEQLPALRSAARTLTALRARIERVEAPDEAKTLRLRLIRFFRQQEAIAHELVAVAIYLPKLGKAERPLVDVNRRLRAGLAQSSSLDAQADAVGAYAVRLRRVARDLEAIEAPKLLVPSHNAYIAQLESYAAASQSLQQGVRANDQAAVDAAVERLRVASVAPPGSARAQRAAIIAFNSRVSRIRTLALAVERERRRLDAEV